MQFKKDKILEVFKSIKLFDPDNTLSLSNLAMMVIIFKLATAPALDWAILTGFFLTLLNHNSKKWFAKSKAQKSLSDTDKLNQLDEAVKSIKSSLALRK